MKNVILIIIISLLVANCKKDVLQLKPKACFDYMPQTFLKIGDSLTFSNCSQNSDSFCWNFGDGSFSYEKSPVHKYNAIGDYKVVLLVSNDSGKDSSTIENYITVVDTSCMAGKYNIFYYYQSQVNKDSIDLNDDGIFDIYCSIDEGCGFGCTEMYANKYIICKSENFKLAIEKNNADFPHNYSYTDTIYKFNNWTNFGAIFYYSSSHGKSGFSNGYIGVKYYNNSKIYYGWIEISDYLIKSCALQK